MCTGTLSFFALTIFTCHVVEACKQIYGWLFQSFVLCDSFLYNNKLWIFYFGLSYKYILGDLKISIYIIFVTEKGCCMRKIYLEYHFINFPVRLFISWMPDYSPHIMKNISLNNTSLFWWRREKVFFFWLSFRK